MKQRITILFAGGLLALALIGIAAAGQLEDGDAAFSGGDYAEAMRLLRPLAERGCASRVWLDAQLGLPHAGPTVVVTHHAPHADSLPPGFDLAHCYASDLSRLIHDRQPNLWVHGHLHNRVDYRLGATRIVCNPRGHADERSGFDPAFTINVPTTAGG
jgi:hypothetical protein